MLVMEDGAQGAVLKRAKNLQELVWRGFTNNFEIRIDAKLPDYISEYLYKKTDKRYTFVRYQVRIISGQNGIGPDREELYLIRDEYVSDAECYKNRENHERFPKDREITPMLPESGQKRKSPPGWTIVARRSQYGPRVNILSEASKKSQRFNIGLDIDTKRSILSVILEDTERFKASLWFKRLIRENLIFIHLNTEMIKKPVSPDAPEQFMPDGSNLAKVIDVLKRKHEDRFNWWVRHIKEYLEDVESINIERIPENNFLYIVMEYKYGVRVPSWLLSDGTLRFLALSIIPYLPPERKIYMIEEPENGLHPSAIEGIFQSLKGGNVSEHQILVATHSPVFLALANLSDLLIFKKTETGATDIIRGDKHPQLADWRDEISIENLIASGVL